MLVSTSNPMVSGRSDWWAKYFIVCACPSCSSTKSSLVRPGINLPCLSRTEASMVTTFTSTEIGDDCGAAGVLPGGATCGAGGGVWEVAGACEVAEFCEG